MSARSGHKTALGQATPTPLTLRSAFRFPTNLSRFDEFAVRVLSPVFAGGRRRTVKGCQLIPAREKSWKTACSQLRALDPDSVASIWYSISLPGLQIRSNAKCIVTFAWSYGMRMGPAWRRKRLRQVTRRNGRFPIAAAAAEINSGSGFLSRRSSTVIGDKHPARMSAAQQLSIAAT